jgi:hypothetical protein
VTNPLAEDGGRLGVFVAQLLKRDRLRLAVELGEHHVVGLRGRHLAA